MNTTKNMPLWLAALIAAIVAVLINLGLLLSLKSYTGVASSFIPLNVMPVAMWSVMGVIGATIVFAIVRKFSKNPYKVFLYIALVVLALSFIPDVLVEGMTTGPFAGATWYGVFLLMTMHIVAAASVLLEFKNVRPVSVSTGA